jgi:putative chitinase
MKINRERFFAGYREEFGRLSQSQVDALTDLLDFIEADETMTDKHHISYVLATIKHETANTFLPIEEYGKGRGRKYGIADKETGQKYYGRGLVQLTWRKNYEVFSKLLDVDLVNDPAQSMEPRIAWAITSLGMRKGLFTGKKLSDFINASKTDFVGARKIINGTDKAQLIAGYASTFQELLSGLREPELPSGDAIGSSSPPAGQLGAADLSALTEKSQPAASNEQQSPSQQTNEAGAAGIIIQPNALTPEPALPIVPIDGKAIDVQAVVPEKSGAKKSIWATIIAGITFLGLNIQAFFSNAYATVKDNPAVAFSLIVGCLVILIVYWKYQERQTKLDELREKQAHELTKLQMELAANQQKYSVNLVRPNQ